jgi:hypothetical protein
VALLFELAGIVLAGAFVYWLLAHADRWLGRF